MIKYLKNSRKPLFTEYPITTDVFEPYRFHQTLAAYKQTPLVSLKNYARKNGIGELYVKDESSRFGLNSFKALGASFAVSRLPQKPELLVSCTDGNHGQGLAWYGSTINVPVRIFMPKGSDERRVARIRKYGAEVVVSDFNYDDTVRYAAKWAKQHNGTLVQDTAFDDYREIPSYIQTGYSTLIIEAVKQLGKDPTHVFLQAGVGTFAGGAIRALAEICRKMPYIGIIEAETCDCFYQSFLKEETVKIGGSPYTIMAGLNCGEPSILVLPVFQKHADWFISVSDDVSLRGMRLSRKPVEGDPVFNGGESGAVGLGVVDEIIEKGLKDEFMMNDDSVILVINTEGKLV